MSTLPALPSYSVREEIASSVMHGIGIVLAIVGLAVLVGFAARHGDRWHVVGCSTFGAALIICFTTSTLYHSIRSERSKHVLRALDHAAIFLLIAGTYSPFMLVNLKGPWGWSLFAVIWTLAIVGIGMRLLLKGRMHGLVVATYLAMGWAVVVAVEPMIKHVALGGLILLASGGLTYTAGVIFYKWRRLPYNHAIWHGFVMAGAAMHFSAVLFYVIPWPPAVA
jgi:hemolysin III